MSTWQEPMSALNSSGEAEVMFSGTGDVLMSTATDDKPSDNSEIFSDVLRLLPPIVQGVVDSAMQTTVDFTTIYYFAT